MKRWALSFAGILCLGVIGFLAIGKYSTRFVGPNTVSQLSYKASDSVAITMPLLSSSLAEIRSHSKSSIGSLQEIYNVMKDSGYKPVGFKVAQAQKKDMVIEGLFIARTWDGHFLVVQSLDERYAYLIDSSLAKHWIAKDAFISHWDGAGLSFRPLPDIFSRVLEFDSNTVDIGTVSPLAKVEFSVRFQNIGGSLVHIKKVESGCLCTDVLVKPKMEFNPDESGLLKGIIKVPYEPGTFNVGITVFSDDSANSAIELTVTGQSKSVFTITPSMVYFAEPLKTDSAVTRVVDVTYPIGDGFAIVDVRPSAQWIDVQLKERAVQSGNENVRLQMTIRPGRLSDGRIPRSFSESILIRTTHPFQKQITIPIEGEWLQPIEVFPKQIFLGVVKSGTPLQFRITIQNNDKANLIRPAIKGLPSSWRATVTPLKEGVLYEVSCSTDRLVPGTLEDHLVIDPGLKSQGPLQVPIRAVVK